MRHLFIINPKAGKYDHSETLSGEISTLMAGRSDPWEVAVTRYGGHATELATEAAGGGESVRIYACGGDGTLNECVAGVAGYPNAAVSQYPVGSGNDFLRIFGDDLPRFRDLAQLIDGEQATADLMDCNGRIALNICSVGLDARVGLGVGRFKKLPLVSGSMAYQLSTIHNVIKGIHQPYRVTIDGAPVTGEHFTLMCVCNGQYYGGGFHPSLDALPDSGELEFIIIEGVSRLKVASIIGRFSKGDIKNIPAIRLYRGREIHIACAKPNLINIDGEGMEGTDITIRVAEKKVNIFFPKGAHWNPALRSEDGTVLRKVEI